MEQKNNEELSKRVIKRPGMSTDRSKALEDLFQAKTTGIRRTAQYEVFLYSFKYFISIF